MPDGTVTTCPNGCGGTVNTATDIACSSCRRRLNTIEYPLSDWCFAWFGPSFHRMRCRKWKGHTGDHCDHEERCGDIDPDGHTYCGRPPKHTGPHGWEETALALAATEASRPASRYPVLSAEEAAAEQARLDGRAASESGR